MKSFRQTNVRQKSILRKGIRQKSTKKCIALATLILGSNVLLAGSVFAGDVTSQVATQQLVKYLNGMQSMQAKFQQWVEDGKQNRLQNVTGSMWVKRPGKFRWDTNDPFPQSIITNGQELWIFDRDLDQATQRKLDAQVGNTPALLLSGDPKTISDSFHVKGFKYDKTGEWRFDLTPKSEEALFELLRVHFMGGKLHDMYLQDGLGQTTRIAFATPDINTKIADSTFEFTPPKGVDVIKDM